MSSRRLARLVVVVACATVVVGVAANDVAARATRTDTEFIRVATFEPCGAMDASSTRRARATDGEACFASDVVGGGEGAAATSESAWTCALAAGTIRDARGDVVDPACGSVDVVGARVVVRMRTSDACARRGDAYRVEARVECGGRDRLFPYSTLLLGEVVALADAAIYLSEAVHTLEHTVDAVEEEAASLEVEDERTTAFTIYWPASF